MYCITLALRHESIVTMSERPVFNEIHGFSISQAAWDEVDEKGYILIKREDGTGCVIVRSGRWKHG